MFLEPKLVDRASPLENRHTAILAKDATAVCIFVNDEVNKDTLKALASDRVRLIALHSAGSNNVDVETAKNLGIKLVRVPAYSPYAVAEHTVGLILTLNRKLHRAYNCVREGNFSLEGLLGFDLHGRTILHGRGYANGIIGTGKIGTVTAQIMTGFGCKVLAYDPYPNPQCEAIGVQYMELSQLFSQSDIITLHCPLTPENHHLINKETIAQMKPHVMLINTSRGALIDTNAIITALKSSQIGALGLDVYEQESALFFEDRSCLLLQDDTFACLMTFPNVIITGHQAFFTEDSMQAISEVIFTNITQIEQEQPCENEI